MSAKVTIEFDGFDIKDLDSVDITFKDGRPTMSKTVSKPDENGKFTSITTVTPYDTERTERKPFGKKAANEY